MFLTTSPSRGSVYLTTTISGSIAFNTILASAVVSGLITTSISTLSPILPL
nr:MAG TPA: hypothetical protein [Caudoviricetes sp.]